MAKVVFRYDKKADEVLAVFPEIVCNICGCVLCYAHIGQHFEAKYPELVANSKLATEEQYNELLAELVAIGYNDLRVMKRSRAIYK